MARALNGEHFYDCGYCEANPAFKVMLGHDGPPQQFYRNDVLTGVKLERCPVRTMQLAAEHNWPLWREVERVRLELLPAYREHGVLPRAGGTDEQDARTMDLLRAMAKANRAVEDKYVQLKLKRETPDDVEG